VHHPNLPRRRAFFVETDTRLSVYAYWGDRVAEDLRHEVVHGYLHAVVPHLPLWLDEGLAEYFEVPRGLSGLWAWVHYLLETSPRHQQLLRDHLQALIKSTPHAPLSDELERLDPRCAERLAEHLALLRHSLE
jgi:hypothetical protein